jgi:TfoX/Sxy family transcriptional regulator of competence genes
VAYDTGLADRIREHLAGEPDLTEKRMFGGLAFLLGGQMAVAAGSHGGLLLRIDPERRDELLSDPRAEPMVMQGRELAGWLTVDTSGTDDTELGRWVEHGVAYVRTLPPK